MIIQSCSYLTPKQLQALSALLDECKRVDHNIVPAYLHLLDKPRSISCNILCNDEQGNMIGFLRPFFFHETMCEMTVMVSPKHRRQGIARRMLGMALPYLKGMANLSFSVIADVDQTWLEPYYMHQTSRQYTMQYLVSEPASEPAFSHTLLPMRLATTKDLAPLCALHHHCFPEPGHPLDNYFSSLLTDPQYSIYVLEKNNRIIGKVHLRWQENSVFLADLAVTTREQRQGLGTQLIMHSIQMASKQHKQALLLDVEEKNQQALALYQRLGFVISNTHDYWKTNLPSPYFGLQTFLHAT